MKRMIKVQTGQLIYPNSNQIFIQIIILFFGARDKSEDKIENDSEDDDLFKNKLDDDED